jgi:3D (Asp-Asp-Asp) domain-containing protein
VIPHACVESVGSPTISFNMRITPALKAIIPRGSLVASGKVLTHNDLQIVVRNAENALAPNVNASVQSDRSVDTVAQASSPTNSSGATTASVETRNQISVSTITSASSTIQTATPGKISWLPAHYQDNFLITCYVISNESDFVNTPLVKKIPGLPAGNKYRQGFISDVRMQGSGQASDGTILHYDGNSRYSIQSCARTATGACAVDGSTIAVDRTVIPLRGSVAIDTVGSRVARDTGGAIVGNHIDLYYGARRADCRAAGRRNLGVDFISY